MSSVFPPAFTDGAGALLGSYDDEPGATPAGAAGSPAEELADRVARRVPVRS